MVGILVLFMMSILLRYFRDILKYGLYSPVTTNWEELYPFRDSLNPVETSIFDKYRAKVQSSQEHINNYVTEKLLFRIYFVETAFNCENLYGWKLHETVYDIDDGWLTEVLEKTDSQAFATAIEELNEYLKKSDIAFLYVQSPYKICRRDSLI
jgi:hypothetical protein